ncbi:hypothetical protein TNCV_2131 [Trichonephila clavipes]|nr:hypothetical protein TNCV_2131 [Trichonephila clavipes]
MEESENDVGSLEQLLLYADEHYLAGKLPLGDHLGKVSKNIINTQWTMDILMDDQRLFRIRPGHPSTLARPPIVAARSTGHWTSKCVVHARWCTGKIFRLPFVTTSMLHIPRGVLDMVDLLLGRQGPQALGFLLNQRKSLV